MSVWFVTQANATLCGPPVVACHDVLAICIPVPGTLWRAWRKHLTNWSAVRPTRVDGGSWRDMHALFLCLRHGSMGEKTMEGHDYTMDEWRGLWLKLAG